MFYYPTIVTLHIIFAGIWLIFFAADIIIKKQYRDTTISEVQNELILLYLQLSNLFGMVGSIGIVATGIILVILNPGYGFFDMSHAHWLATKQIFFVLILLITFFKLIPKSKKLSNILAEGNSEEVNKQFEAVVKINMVVTILVILNFIFAITHRFIGS